MPFSYLTGERKVIIKVKFIYSAPISNPVAVAREDFTYTCVLLLYVNLFLATGFEIDTP